MLIWKHSYGNNYANVGTVSGAVPGKYLVRFTNSDFGLKKGDDKYRGYINTPTTYGLILVRIAVAPTSKSDQKKVNALQDQIKVKAIKRPGKPIAPAMDSTLFGKNGTTGTTPFEKLLSLTARTAEYNQPEVVGDRKWVADLLAKSGMKGGKYTKPAGVDLDVAAKELNATLIKGLTSPGSVLQLNNGWTQLAPKISGHFYSEYWARAFVAWAGYLQVTSDVALYPTWNVFSSGGGAEAFSVGPDEAYVFTFSKKPDLVKNGFWSLTAYGEDQYLIPNKMNTYILGDRNNITYPDGELVYPGRGKGSKPEEEEEKQFQILVQPADVVPPSNWTSNWLPAPSGGGKMTLNCKFTPFYSRSGADNGRILIM